MKVRKGKYIKRNYILLIHIITHVGDINTLKKFALYL